MLPSKLHTQTPTRSTSRTNNKNIPAPSPTLQLRPWISVIYHSSHTTLLRAIRSLLSAHLSRNSEAASIFKTYFWPLVHFIHLQVYHGFLSTHPLFLDCSPQGRTIPLIHFISHHLSPVFLQVPTLLVFYVPRPCKLTLSFVFLFSRAESPFI